MSARVRACVCVCVCVRLHVRVCTALSGETTTAGGVKAESAAPKGYVIIYNTTVYTPHIYIIHGLELYQCIE